MSGLVPNKKGWIKKYFSLIQNQGFLLKPLAIADLALEELIYWHMQPTGILYGYPTGFLFLNKVDAVDLTNQDKFKILLLEGLIGVECLDNDSFSLDNVDEFVQRCVEFYTETDIEQAKKGWFDFKGMDDYQKLESIIDRRVDIKTSFSHKLWTSYLYNSLIFTDLLFYNDYRNGTSVEVLKVKHLDIMLDVIKIISLAAHADGELQDEEKAIFEVFMASANLDGDHQTIAESFWEGGKTIDDLDFNHQRSWLFNRYFIEIAVLTVWSDLIVSDKEQLFLERLSTKLNIHIEERDKAFIAIQNFVAENHSMIPFFKGNNDMELLVSGATERWKSIISRNKDKIAAELKESKELVGLIKKSRSTELSPEEREKVKSQFKDLARTVPSLTLFLLPGGTLLLPIVLKIIPDLVPTAFRSNQIEEKSDSIDNENGNTAS